LLFVVDDFAWDRHYPVAVSGSHLPLDFSLELAKANISPIFYALIANSAHEPTRAFDSRMECTLQVMINHNQTWNLEN
jgi:hypothetical protein